MKPVIRYQSQLLYRKSYKPTRVVRVRPMPGLTLVFRPMGINPNPKPLLTV